MNLANLYYTGQGVDENKARAAYWYEAAAKHGLKEAQTALANMLLTGDGIEKDEQKGSVWMKISEKNK